MDETDIITVGAIADILDDVNDGKTTSREALARVRALLSEGEPPCMYCDGHGCHGPLLESGDPTPCKACEGTGIETGLHSLLGELDALAAALLRDDCDIDIVEELRRIAKHHAIPRGEPAKVRDESKPAPGWYRRPSMGFVREGMVADTARETWEQYDDEHGYAPQGAPPNHLCPLHSGELECLCGEEP